MKQRKIKIAFLAITAVFLALAATIHLIEKYSDYRFLLGEINGNGITIYFLICASVFLVATAISALTSKNEKNKFLHSLISFLFVGVIISNACVLGVSGSDMEYYKFISPDNKYTVIAEEWSYLLGGGVNFYERVNPFFVVRKKSFGTDDGYRAISSQDYSVEWNNNTMLFTAQNGNNFYTTVKIEANE